jgi:DNA repair protein RecO (recombination protein O)
MPEASDLAGLRRALRLVLLHHLGGRGLKSWDLLGELGRLGGARNAPSDD